MQAVLRLKSVRIVLMVITVVTVTSLSLARATWAAPGLGVTVPTIPPTQSAVDGERARGEYRNFSNNGAVYIVGPGDIAQLYTKDGDVYKKTMYIHRSDLLNCAAGAICKDTTTEYKWRTVISRSANGATLTFKVYNPGGVLHFQFDMPFADA